MINEHTYEGFVKAKDGDLTFHNKIEDNFFRKFLEQHDEQKLWLTIEAKKPTRTAKQNSFYWAYLEKIAEKSGHIPDELHNTFKHAFLNKQQVEGIGNRKYDEPPSTTGLSKQEFNDYIRKIEMKTGISAPSKQRYGL